ncbi:glycosyltransferase family 8 protein [Amniculicola lignicola CBS 123094]|uniref:Glycosyltransferase family 8 protein n=1 Tax=Amniculicola lignicola CBS 123094 TaxID=1392246 RepID=A0A6A5WUB0_9PLEO|nr:glycosyltransferase family 8 protein [Amniculicola lignicola CBS 123094]
MSWSNWLRSRRVRTALLLVVAVVIILTLANYSSLPDRIHDLAPLANSSSPAVSAPNQGAKPNQDPVVGDVQWSDFAYVQYVTNPIYLCNSLMILEALNRVGSKADRLMMYPQEWELPKGDGSEVPYESKLLAQAKDVYKTKLVPIKVMTFTNSDPTWQDSYTKLLAFNQTQYKRVISLDSDATVLQSMDELFLLPPAPVAMPRAYWLDQPFLSSQLIVIEPSKDEWRRVEEATQHHEGSDYDMDILNKMYKDSCTIIPHRGYDLLTGEFKHQDHDKYLGNKDEKWDARQIMKEAKFLHFSDWPLPKPWLKPSESDLEHNQPQCWKVGDDKEDCTDRDVWLENRKDFSERRKVRFLPIRSFPESSHANTTQRVCGNTWENPRRDKRSILRARAPWFEPIFP